MTAFIIKLNGTPALLSIRIPILSMSEKFQFQVGAAGTPARRAWPLPSHFHSCPLGAAIHQDPGRGHLPPAHKCMEQAIKLTLWQLFSHPFDGLVSAHLLRRRRNKKVKLGCAKNYDSGWGWGGRRGVPEWSRANARLWSQTQINQCWGVVEKTESLLICVQKQCRASVWWEDDDGATRLFRVVFVFLQCSHHL